MRAIRCQKHHRKHSEPCQVFPFCVKLQRHKCWKHCSYWVLSEVPIFQRDPPVPIEIMEQPVGNQWKCWCELDVGSPKSDSQCSPHDRELYLKGTCWDVSVAELHLPGLWGGVKGQSPRCGSGSTLRALHRQQPARKSLSPAQGCSGGERD